MDLSKANHAANHRRVYSAAFGDRIIQNIQHNEQQELLDNRVGREGVAEVNVPQK
jgi:hypothetical protein